MKHILFISNEISLDTGGIQNYSYLLAEYLSYQTKETVICSFDSKLTGYTDNLEIIKSKYTSQQFKKFTHNIFSIVIKQHLKKKFEYSLIAQYSLGSSCLWLKKIFDVPYGVLAHGNEVFGNVSKNKIKNIILKRYRKIIFDNAKHIFANSEYTANLVRKITQNPNIIVIHPPIKYIEKPIPTTNKNFILVSIGRIVERKGFQNVIYAIKEVIKSYPQLKYYIAGSGEYEKQLKELVVKLDLTNSVIFLGKITEEKKEELLRMCDLFAMPSYTISSQNSVEGFGIVYLEANSFGKFVIASKSGGIPDAIIDGETGILVPENDIESIKSALFKFYKSEITYSPNKCILWAQKHDISIIGNTFLNYINKNHK